MIRYEIHLNVRHKKVHKEKPLSIRVFSSEKCRDKKYRLTIHYPYFICILSDIAMAKRKIIKNKKLSSSTVKHPTLTPVESQEIKTELSPHGLPFVDAHGCNI